MDSTVRRLSALVIAALASELDHDRLQSSFSHGAVECALQPLMKMERFGAGRVRR